MPTPAISCPMNEPALWSRHESKYVDIMRLVYLGKTLRNSYDCLLVGFVGA